MCVIELCVTVSKKLCKWIHAISYLYFSRCHMSVLLLVINNAVNKNINKIKSFWIKGIM